MSTDLKALPLLHGALDLAELDIPVFPLRTKSKIPAIPKDKGGNGMLDATTDPDQIIDWWTRFPNANIAIRTGIVVDVLDIDSASGLEALRSLPNFDGLEGPMVKTSRGWHFWFQTTGLQSKTGFLAACDFRGKDASCTAPPSIHESGHKYVWQRRLDYSAASMFPIMPAWLVAAIGTTKQQTKRRPTADAFDASKTGGSVKSEAYVKTVVENELLKLRTAAEGTRNATLNGCAFNVGQLCGDGLITPFDAAQRLYETAVAIGLGESESLETIKSGLYKGMQQPRSAR